MNRVVFGVVGGFDDQRFLLKIGKEKFFLKIMTLTFELWFGHLEELGWKGFKIL